MRKQSTQPIRTAQVRGANIKIINILNEALHENVVIANHGTVPQPLSGWALASLRGDSLFFFPDDLILWPDNSLYVHSGKGTSGTMNAHEPNRALHVHLFWTDDQVWNNHGDIAVLFDAYGEEVDRYAYPRNVALRSAARRRKLLVHSGERWRIVDQPRAEAQAVRRRDKRPLRL